MTTRSFPIYLAQALVALEPLEEPERLVGLLEERGRTLDRVWALAVAAHCRALLLASRGDPEAAIGRRRMP